MNMFTSGKWIVKELFTTWGVFAVNEGERKPVADCLEETDARLIAAAPEMYELLKVWTQIRAEPTLKEARDTARKLLARIDGEEAQNE